MAKVQKVLVSGDVNGHFKQLFAKVGAVQKKVGQFDMLLCLGEFFGDNNNEWEPYASGDKKVPIQTYILGPQKQEVVKYFKDEQICENVLYLGKRGVLSSGGLVIAYLSGLDGTKSDLPTDTTFTGEDVDYLIQSQTGVSGFKGVDILLTSAWPYGVEKYASEMEGFKSTEAGSKSVSQLALALKPRYHFCGTHGVHYERQPYRNHQVLQEAAKHVTRVIALSKAGNPGKKKYLYAFNVEPMKTMDQQELVKQPDDSTECPYKIEDILQKKVKAEKDAQFFYDQKALDKKDQKRPMQIRGGDGPPPKKRPQPTGPCWFCLGSPEVEKHLVISVGTQTYLALAKGPLVADHCLILPIAHYQCSVTSAPEVLEEVEKYKSALRKCFKKQGKVVVFFERNFRSQHLQVQVVPVPAQDGPFVKEIFKECAAKQKIELAEIPRHSDLKQIVPSGAPFFYVELPSGEKLLHRISRGFPLQFGREVLAHESLLNLPDKIDWRNCKNTKEEESQLVEHYRTIFKDFDFNTL